MELLKRVLLQVEEIEGGKGWIGSNCYLASLFSTTILNVDKNIRVGEARERVDDGWFPQA